MQQQITPSPTNTYFDKSRSRQPRCGSIAKPLLAVALLIIGCLWAGCVERKPERLERRESPVTSDLKDMVEACHEMQANSQIEPETYKQTMIVFRNRVYDLVTQALIREPEDLARAAEVLLASDMAGGEADCLLAFYMARNAAEKGMGDARYLAARCIDRYMVTSGQLQRFGTQVVKGPDGKFELAPYDPNTSDEERAEWGVPPLQELMEQGDTVGNITP